MLLIQLFLGLLTFFFTLIDNNTMGVQMDLKCKRNWIQFGARCFMMFTAPTTWNASEQTCITMDAHLASVHNGDEYAYLEALVLGVIKSNAMTWLGANNIVQNAVWLWTDGSAFIYTKWASGQPDNYGNKEHCLQMNYAGGWNDIACTTLSPSICSKPAIPAKIKSVIRFKIISDKDMLASDIKNLFQQVRQKLLDSGMPTDSTLLLQRLFKIST